MDEVPAASADSGSDDRPSRLTQPLAILLLVVAALLAILAVAMPVSRLFGDTAATTVNLTKAASTVALDTVTDLPRGVEATPTDGTGLTVNLVATAANEPAATCTTDCPPPPLALRLLTDAGTSLWAAALALVAYLLARILGNLAHGDPFHPSHPRRITVIAAAILLASAGADTVNFVSAFVFTDYYDSPRSISVTAYYSLIPIGIAAVVLVMASAFRAGRRITEDVEGLV